MRMWFGRKFNDDMGPNGRGARSHTRPFPHERSSSAQLAQEFLLIHAVLEGFAAVDEDYGDLIGIEASDFGVGVDVDFSPGEAATLVQLDDALFDDFAEMTSLAGINEDFPRRRHARECSSFGARFPTHRVPGKDGVESRDDDERNGTFRKDDPRDGSGEATGARDCFGRSR